MKPRHPIDGSLSQCLAVTRGMIHLWKRLWPPVDQDWSSRRVFGSGTVANLDVRTIIAGTCDDRDSIREQRPCELVGVRPAGNTRRHQIGIAAACRANLSVDCCADRRGWNSEKCGRNQTNKDRDRRRNATSQSETTTSPQKAMRSLICAAASFGSR